MMMITMPMIITIVSGQPGQEKRLGGGGGGAGTVAAAPSTVGKVVACPRWAKTSKTARLVPAKTSWPDCTDPPLYFQPRAIF